MDINDKIAEHKGLIYNQLIRFNLVYDQDAESEAYEALYRAILTYDEKAGTVFSTYAVCVIANALRKHLRTLNKKRQLDVVSYNGPITADGDSDDWVDIISQHRKETEPESLALFNELQGVVRASFLKVFNELSDKHKDIVAAWYRSEYKMTQCEIAKALHISQPTVSKALSIFKYKLRLELEEYM